LKACKIPCCDKFWRVSDYWLPVAFDRWNDHWNQHHNHLQLGLEELPQAILLYLPNHHLRQDEHQYYLMNGMKFIQTLILKSSINWRSHIQMSNIVKTQEFNQLTK
jgi:hypothetical protein